MTCFSPLIRSFSKKMILLFVALVLGAVGSVAPHAARAQFTPPPGLPGGPDTPPFYPPPSGMPPPGLPYPGLPFPLPPGGGLPDFDGFFDGLTGLIGDLLGKLNRYMREQQLPVLEDQRDRLLELIGWWKMNLERLDDPASWSTVGRLEEVNEALATLEALVFTAQNIDEELQELFPLEAPYESTALEEQMTRAERTVATMRGAVRVMQTHAERMQSDAGLIDELRAQSEAATGGLAASQAQTNALLFQTENLRQLRHQVATLANIMAVQNMQEVNRRMQQAHTAAEETRVYAAAAPWTEITTRPVTFD
jgi:hypothetical protein